MLQIFYEMQPKNLSRGLCIPVRLAVFIIKLTYCLSSPPFEVGASGARPVATTAWIHQCGYRDLSNGNVQVNYRHSSMVLGI